MDAMKDLSWDCYVVVQDPSTGKTVGRGDVKLAYKHILAEKSKKKRESGEWIPSTPIPKLPSRLNKLMSDTVAVRSYASTSIKQKINQTTNRKLNPFQLIKLKKRIKNNKI